jgi:hypothetical protein
MEHFIKRLSQDNVAEVANQSAGWRPEVMPLAASAERK